MVSVLALAGFGSPALAADTASAGLEGQDDSLQADRHAPHKKIVIKKKAKAAKKVLVVKRQPVPARRVVVKHRAVVVHSGPPVVNTVAVVPRRERSVTEAQYGPRPTEDKMLGLGVRLSGVAVEGEKLNLATVENPTMGGLGVQLRGKTSPNVGLELGADWLYGDTGEVKQVTVPVMLSLMYYFVPRGPMKLYGLIGGGVHLTKLEYPNGFREDLRELAGQAGGGIELRLSPDFGINADLRFLGLYHDLDDRQKLEAKCISLTPDMNCGGVNNAEKFNMGAQLMVGASLYF